MLGQDCIQGRCRCSAGFREKTEEELRIVPTDTRECVELSLNFSFYHAYDERCFADNNPVDLDVGEAMRLGMADKPTSTIRPPFQYVESTVRPGPLTAALVSALGDETDGLPPYSTKLIVTTSAVAVSTVIVVAMVAHAFVRKWRRSIS